MTLINFFLAGALYNYFLLIYVNFYKGIRFANVKAVENGWCKPIYMYLYKNLLPPSTIFKQINNQNALQFKCLYEFFCNSQFRIYNCNSTHSCNGKTWIDIVSSTLRTPPKSDMVRFILPRLILKWYKNLIKL